MPVTQAEVALGMFTLCNSVRVIAYFPQIVKIGRDRQGATAISYTTWILFGISHFSTVFYAVLVVDDWRMAAVFAANTLCCLLILGLTVWKRLQFRAQEGIQEPSMAFAHDKVSRLDLDGPEPSQGPRTDSLRAAGRRTSSLLDNWGGRARTLPRCA